MKKRKLLLFLLPSLWLAMTNLAVSAEEGPSSEEVAIDQAFETEALPAEVGFVDDSSFQAEEVEQVENVELYSSENAESEEDPTVFETADFETERLEHVISPNAPPSEASVESQDESSVSSSFSLEELENDSDEFGGQDLKIQESHANPNHPDYLEDDHVAIIVETRNRPALNLADYRDREAFEQAVEEADEEVEDSYSVIQEQLAELGYDLEARHQYSASFTGFSAFVPRWVAEELRLMDQVVSVSEQQQVKVPRDEPSMHSSPEMIDLIKMYEHELPYKGAGMVVAVIDTGIDPDHPDFVLADDVEMRYTEEEMNAKIDELGLKGRWYSNKIPYGYNYIDDVQTVKDRNEHGIHVAGTIGANGDPANGGVRGVAPHVQILAMKAFSNDPGFAGVYEDTWMKAFDDSIKLGADVINMSLGGTAGFSLGASKPSAQAFQLARSKGIIPVVANGNDRNINWGNDFTSLKDNPDTLLTGSPALIQESLAVASVDNIRQMVSYVEVTYGDGQVETFEGASVDPFLYTEEAYPFIEAGLGREQDYEEIDSLDGHYVIVQRGESTFADKYDQAAARGAEGIIVYDNVDSESLIRMGGVNQPRVPMIMLHRQSGLRILELQEIYGNVQVRIPQGMIQKETPTGNQVSDFSTWGPTNDLRLKPEIAAPGGNIYSLMSDGKYQDMSGTSMATPHIAGVAALVMERLIKDGYITEENAHMKDDLATLMMMNTATPLVNTQANSKHYYSPIQQGAGLVNVYNAVTNDVIVMATGGRDTTPDGKLELGDKIGSRFDFQLIFHNLGNEARTYDIETELIRDLFDENNRYTEETTYAQVNWLGQVTIQPGQTVVYNFTQPTFRIENNQYIQGYITMHSAQPDEAPNLSIPILGFKGEWDQLPIVDKLASFSPREEINIKPLSLGNLPDGTEVFLDTGFTRQPHDTSRLWTYWNAWNTDLDRTVFVNPQPNETYVSEVTPIFSFLRDGVDVDYFIEDSSGEKIRHLDNRMTVTKVNRLYLRPTNYLQVQPSWDFTDADGDLVEDGVYKYVVTGRIDDPEARKQRHEYTIVVDQTPVQVNSRVDGNLLTLQLTDNVSGIDQYAILNNTATQILEIFEVDKTVNPRLLEKEVLFTIPADFVEQDLIVLVIDNSGNVTIEFLSLAPVVEEVDPNEDWLVNQEVDPEAYTFEEGILTSEMPVLAIQTPGIFAAYGLTTEEIVISGTVSNLSELHRLEYQFVNFAGQVVDSNTLEAVRYLDDPSGSYYYSGRVDMTDKKVSDQYKVRVRAYVKSDQGNLVQHQVARPIYVDYVAPYLEVKQVYGPDDTRAYFEVTFGDDHPYVGVYRDKDFVTQVDNTYNSLAPIPVSGQVNYDFKLKPGKEQAVFVAEDIVGNRTELLVNIVANRSLANVVEEVNALDETTEENATPVETTTGPRLVRKVVAPVADGQPIVPREPAVLAGGLSQVAFTAENGTAPGVIPEVSANSVASESETEEVVPVENESAAEVETKEVVAPEEAKPVAESDSEAEKVAPGEVTPEGSKEPTEETTDETPVPVENESAAEVESEEVLAPEDTQLTPEVFEEKVDETKGSEGIVDEDVDTIDDASSSNDGNEGQNESAQNPPVEAREKTSNSEDTTKENTEEAQADKTEGTFVLVNSDHGVEVALPLTVKDLYSSLSVELLDDVTLTTDILDDYDVAYYDINLLDEAGNIKSLTEPVVVKLPDYQGLKARGVYYLPSPESQPELLENMKQNPEDGTVEFTTNHFSVYAVAYGKESEDLADDKSTEKSVNESRQDLASSVQEAKGELEEVKKQALSSGNKTQELEAEIKAAEDLLKDEGATADDLDDSRKAIDELRQALTERKGPSIPVSYPSEAAQSSGASNRLPATGENPFNHFLMLIALISIFIANLLFSVSFKS